MQFWLWSILSCLKTCVWSSYIKNVLWRAGIILTAFSKDLDILFRTAHWPISYCLGFSPPEKESMFLYSSLVRHWQLLRQVFHLMGDSKDIGILEQIFQQHPLWVIASATKRCYWNVRTYPLLWPVRNNKTTEMVPRGMKHDMIQGSVSKPLLLKGHVKPPEKIVS